MNFWSSVCPHGRSYFIFSRISSAGTVIFTFIALGFVFQIIDPCFSKTALTCTNVSGVLLTNQPNILSYSLNSFIHRFFQCTHPERWYLFFITYYFLVLSYSRLRCASCHRILLLLNLLHSTTTSLYTDCRSNLYAGSPSYLLILFSALSAFAVGGLSIERNQKPLAPEITLAVTHHDRQKQVEVKRSSCVNPHEIRLFSGCPYAVVK